MSEYSLSFREKLKSTKEFSALFTKGKSFTSYPVKAIFHFEQDSVATPFCQTAFSVSKRNFKKAKDRNRIKRLMREAFRLNKGTFYDYLTTSGKNCRLILIFLDRKLPEFSDVQDKIILILQRLQKEHEEVTKRHPDIPSKDISKSH